MNHPRSLAVASALLMGAVLWSCGGGNNTPANPTPASPTPAPPAPTPAAFSCPLPPSSNPQDNCFEGQPELGALVNTAIDRVIAARPELFNLTELNGGNPRVLNRDGYWQAVKGELEKQGVCTIIQKEELAIKNTNTFNEQWNIQTSAGFVRRRYVTTCTPAWF